MRYLLPKEGALPQQVELVSGYAMHSHLFVVQLAGVSDRNQAEKLRNYLLAVAKNDLPPRRR